MLGEEFSTSRFRDIAEHIQLIQTIKQKQKVFTELSGTSPGPSNMQTTAFMNIFIVLRMKLMCKQYREHGVEHLFAAAKPL